MYLAQNQTNKNFGLKEKSIEILLILYWRMKMENLFIHIEKLNTIINY